jgi:two-component system chemotaxis response regulator CheY
MATVMIVDDSTFMRMMLKKIMVELGHEVIAEGENGVEAVAIHKEMKPDLITLDITMPEMNGIEAARVIRSTDPDVKLLMCSAMGQQRLIIEAIEVGANDFVIKPFDKDRIKDALNNIFRQPKPLG